MIRIAAAMVAVLSLAVLGLALHNSRLSAQAAIANKEAAELRMSIVRAQEVITVHQAAFERDQKSLISLDQKIKELRAHVAALPDRDAECLSPDDTERLRNLWAD